VTHDQAEALTMSDRMAVMLDGQILQIGSPEEVYTKPKTVDVAKFVGSPPINLLPGDVNGSGALTALGEIFGQSGMSRAAVLIGLRPEHIAIADSGPRATIVHKENLGSDVFLHVHLEDGGQRIILRAAAGTPAEPGQEVRLHLDVAKATLFDAAGQRLPFRANSLVEVA
jgi:multiple sugar transport system ATP-binding protein